MPESKSPAFQFYPKDFLSDEKQIQMSLPAVGMYIRLLCHCWIEGSLPTDPAALARLAGATTRQWNVSSRALEACFECKEGRLYSPRLDRERDKQVNFKRTQSDRINRRWSKNAKENVDCTTSGNTGPYASGNTNARNTNAPYYSSSSSSSAIKNKYKEAPAAPAHVYVSDEITEKAGAFLRRYQVIYAEERQGAHFPLKPVLHFQTACELVQGWPDLARLELMLRTFCKLPASEKMAWPGTPAQFKHLAPSIDARLRQAGV